MAKAATSVVLWLFFCTILSAHALTPDIKRPTWSDLTPAQQQVLGPLKPDWDRLDVVRRKKWVGVADRFPKMKLEEQKRLQQRMKDWAQLSPEQRRAARERYKAFNQLPADKRQEIINRWAEAQDPPAQQPAQAADTAEADTAAASAR